MRFQYFRYILYIHIVSIAHHELFLGKLIFVIDRNATPNGYSFNTGVRGCVCVANVLSHLTFDLQE